MSPPLLPPESAGRYWNPCLSEIVPILFIGNERSLLDDKSPRSNHIGAAVSLVAAPDGVWSQPYFKEELPHHLFVECIDSPIQDLLQHMTVCCDFIDARLESKNAVSLQMPQYDSNGNKYDMRARVHDLSSRPKSNKPPHAGVLVHCQMGISRSATIVIAYLMRKQRQGLDEVLKQVRAKRRRINPNENFSVQLGIWEE